MTSRKSTPGHKNRFADIPPITDFASCQAARPLLLHRFGDIIGVWQGCDQKPCRRRKSCQRSDNACLFAFMDKQPDESRRYLRYVIENRRAGLKPDEACRRAEARVEDEIARDAAELNDRFPRA